MFGLAPSLVPRKTLKLWRRHLTERTESVVWRAAHRERFSGLPNAVR